MPFSSVLGASSAIKPGVVTSSTRPSTPYVGQLIFETDTSRLAVYNGSAWVTQNGLQLITTAALSGTTVSVNNCFSSTYENYLITCGDMVLNSTTSRDIGFRLRASGTDSSSSSYARETLGAYAASVFSAASTETQHLISSVVDSTLRFQFTLELFSPFSAVPTGISSRSYGYRNGGGNQIWIQSAFHTASTSYDGFSIYNSTQSFTSGTVYVYGLAKV
jgi:hypothetical protein